MNKMDLVDWSEERFIEIRDQFEEFLPRLDMPRTSSSFPSARSTATMSCDSRRRRRGIQGPTLLGPSRDEFTSAATGTLSEFPAAGAVGQSPEQSARIQRCTISAASAARSPAAWSESASRSWSCPAGFTSTVKEIWTYDGSLAGGFLSAVRHAGASSTISMSSRGDMIVGPDDLPGASTDLHAKICWMHPRPLQRGQKVSSSSTRRKPCRPW